MIIKSAENLRKNYDVFSDLAHATGEPIYITANGEGDLVLLSIEAYEKLKGSSQTVITGVQKRKKEGTAMTTYVLGNVLREMYSTSKRGQQVTNIHVFAIYYGNIIEREKVSLFNEASCKENDHPRNGTQAVPYKL